MGDEPEPPKLTKEEKAALKKAEAEAKKAAKALAKLEYERQLKRDAVQREVEYGKKTQKKHEKEWKEMLIEIALPRVRAAVGFAWHNFERVIDAKDFTISLLMDELDYAEFQYVRNFGQHLDNIQNIMNMFAETLREFKDDFEAQLELFHQKTDEDANYLKGQFDEDADSLRTNLYCLERQKKNQEKTMRVEYIGRMKDEQLRNALTLQKLKMNLEYKYQKLIDDSKIFLEEYNKGIVDRKKEHDRLCQQDIDVNAVVEVQYEKIKDCYSTIRNLKQKYNNIKLIEEQRLTELEAEVKFFHETFEVFKKKLRKDLSIDKKKITFLSDICNSVFDYLKKLNEEGKKILTLVGVCRKFETQEEKVIAFPSTQFKEHLDISDLPKEYEKKLELFWQRMGRINCRKIAFVEEMKYLQEQNAFLISKMKEYCKQDDAKITPNNLSKNCTISVTDGRQVANNYGKWKCEQ